LEPRRGNAAALLGEAPRGHAEERAVTRRRRRAEAGDLLIAEAAAALARLRDRLAGDGDAEAAELVADLVEAASDFLASRERRAGRSTVVWQIPCKEPFCAQEIAPGGEKRARNRSL
jgi:hypothetical protein